MKYVNVVIDNNNDNTDRFYTYLSQWDDIGVGQKVLVPFARGNKIKDAYVVEVLEEPESPIKNLKEILEINREISLSQEAMETAIWMRKRFFCRYIEGIKCFLPVGKPLKSGKSRNPLKDLVAEVHQQKTLTEEQSEVLSSIEEALENKCHKTFLLHGVTGSGKTEVYMRASEKAISQGRNVIMLVPEISLTGQTIDRFISKFGIENVAVLHSKLSQGERYDQWMQARRGQVKIVIGARSGVFAPCEPLGLLILDEEHEATYKSDMTPKYNAKAIAIKRAELSQGVVIMGSATPDISTFYKALNKEYQLLSMKERHNLAPMPEAQILDMRQELLSGNKSIFSRTLYGFMENTLQNKGQVILFLNRRGYSTFVSCRSCGYVVKCDTCGISMTYHKSENSVVCHVCGHSTPSPQVCPKCESKYIKYFGTGTEKVEELTREFFPEYVTDRLDMDTSRKKGSIQRILQNFKKEKTKILIGTQLVAKGLDFANVGLVGIITADISLNIPDYRAAERTFQLITQAAGRTGRGDKKGTVVIQTYNPEHYAIITASYHNYAEFYKTEIRIRKALLYPPFCTMMQIVFTAEEMAFAKEISKKFLKEFVQMVGSSCLNRIFGPREIQNGRLAGGEKSSLQMTLKVLDEELEEFSEYIYLLKTKYSNLKKTKCSISIDIT